MASEGATEMDDTNTKKKVLLLKTCDGKVFEVEEEIALQFYPIKSMIDDGCADGEISLGDICSDILTKVIEYCRKHVAADGSSSSKEELKTWDAQFVRPNDDRHTLLGLINAANYLEIKDLLDLTCQAVADMIKDKTPEEVRDIFGIENDFTPEEEAKIRDETKWAFD